MPFVDPPDFVDGDILLEGQMDTLSEDLVYLRDQLLQKIRVLATTANGMGGTPPDPTTSEFVFQGGTSVINTDASANGTLPFPVAFPLGVLAVVACGGDTVAANYSVNFGAGATTRFGADFHASGTGGAADPISQSIRISWMAIGW